MILNIYKILKKFPKKEQFALTDQLRRCTISISSNIVEGFSRQTKKEKLQFYYMCKGSLTELQNQLLIARDIGYMTNIEIKNIANQTVIVEKLITGLTRTVMAK